MKENVGTLDKIIRIPLGIIMIVAGIYLSSFWGLLGIIPLISGVSGFCPLYSVFDISTAKVR
ncbi:DUF2892 domain-containing protein [Aliifodinibius halophilus]|uniref:DUF2892 domain-containing protein n=1 Tax=Fodinibius halophilus TaxID=1736908 RepID=A0A6M1TII4_9BACT|nr:DUF2892 domain-containing protein [Fodinibius halophilus]